jgi:tRNA dimethylallyltransferase
VRALLPAWRPRAPAFRALGAAEFREALEGRMPLAAARDAAVLATRRYAKRQRTWFRARMSLWTTLPWPASDLSDVALRGGEVESDH